MVVPAVTPGPVTVWPTAMPLPAVTFSVVLDLDIDSEPTLDELFKLYVPVPPLPVPKEVIFVPAATLVPEIKVPTARPLPVVTVSVLALMFAVIVPPIFAVIVLPMLPVMVLFRLPAIPLGKPLPNTMPHMLLPCILAA